MREAETGNFYHVKFKYSGYMLYCVGWLGGAFLGVVWGFLRAAWRMARKGVGNNRKKFLQYSAAFAIKPCCLSRAVYFFLYVIVHGGTYVQ
ncbi:hypothetical protein ES703_14879 [subsurface metagenome]